MCSRPDRDEATDTGAWSSEGPEGQARLSVLSCVHLFTPYGSLGGRCGCNPILQLRKLKQERLCNLPTDTKQLRAELEVKSRWFGPEPTAV